MYTRSSEKADQINTNQKNLGWELPKNIEATADLKNLCDRCPVLFIAVPSVNFSALIKDLSPFLNPRHMIIHGVKGFEIQDDQQKSYQINPNEELDRKSTRLNSSHVAISYAVFCLKKK